MNIAIVGSTGYIAGYLIKAFSKKRNVDKILTIDMAESADMFLDLQKPDDFSYQELKCIDYVIMTAAISGPDKCAQEYDLCWSINVTGTAYFIDKAIAQGCKVVFFSSDAVFGDIPGKIYDENSKKMPLTPYGKMKNAIEEQFEKEENFKAIRLSYVVSARDKFVSYCLSCLKEGKEADIFHPFYRNCISVSDVVNVVQWLTDHWKDFEPVFLNVAGKELVSRVRMADEINRYLDNKLRYVISVPQNDFYRNRPRITHMKSLYLDKYNIIEDNSFTEKIQKELEDIKNGN